MVGGDTDKGNTRTHLEHDGEAFHGLGYCTGEGMGKQMVANLLDSLTSYC